MATRALLPAITASVARSLTGAVRGTPHWVCPLALCALFAAVALPLLDDYKIVQDSPTQRAIAVRTLAYILGDAGAYWEPDQTDSVNNYYGAAFEILPLFIERILQLEDVRDIYLTRHLMTHLFFIIAGWFCYHLVYRMTNSRLLGLFAMLLFLLHPRIYGNSFFNSKDVPFLSMFIVALYCVHWAFRRGTVGAFLVCGAAVGILVNLRIMGIILLPAVLTLRAADLYFASGRTERNKVLISGAAFALAAIAIYYASMPYLWSDPIGRFAELIATSARHPTQGYELFQARKLYSGDLPPHYIPTWIVITTPPAALLLSGIGMASGVGRALAAGIRNRAAVALRNTELRFELLLIAVILLSLLGVALLLPHFIRGWQHMYYLWAPLCLLAPPGLRAIAAGLGRLSLSLPLPTSPSLRRIPAAAWLGALAIIILAASAIPVIRLHPYQQLYFNFLVDRTTPEYLGTQYHIDYSRSARLEGYKYLLHNHPGQLIYMSPGSAPSDSGIPDVLTLFAETDRQRFVSDPNTVPGYYVDHGGHSLLPPGAADLLLPPVIYARQLYHNTIMRVMAADLSLVDASIADAYRAIYRTATQDAPALRSHFEVYRSGRQLTLAKADCRPADAQSWFRIWMYPARDRDLPDDYRRLGRTFTRTPVITFDGKCLAQITLPDYPIGRIDIAGVGTILSDAYIAGLRQQYDALAAAKPAIQSEFSGYMQNGMLHYLKPQCTQHDAAARFFLHLTPVDESNLPENRRQYGYANLDFQWSDFVAAGVYQVMRYGIAFEGRCLITVPLPEYPIAAIRTGQYVPGAGRLWSGEFAASPAIGR